MVAQNLGPKNIEPLNAQIRYPVYEPNKFKEEALQRCQITKTKLKRPKQN
jgi:hypothetical protein